MTESETLNLWDRATWYGYAAGRVLACTQLGEVFSANDCWRFIRDVPANRRLLGYPLRQLVAHGHLEVVGSTTSDGGHGSAIRMYRRVSR